MLRLWPRLHREPGPFVWSASAYGNCVPDLALRMGCVFPLEPSAETTSRNPVPEWDAVSGSALNRKLRPRISLQSGRGCGQKVGPRGGPDWRFACTAGRRSSSSSWRRRTAWGPPPPRSSRGSRWARPRSGRRGTSRTATPGRAVESWRGNRHGRRPAWAPTSRPTPRPRPARSPGSTRTR